MSTGVSSGMVYVVAGADIAGVTGGNDVGDALGDEGADMGTKEEAGLGVAVRSLRRGPITC